MKSTLDIFLNKLKSEDILDRKPGLKLCSNHFKDTFVKSGRYWNSHQRGQAIRDGKGWYK